MLIEAIGLVVIVAGVFAFAAACAWSAQTLKRETGSVFSLSNPKHSAADSFL